MRSRGPGGGEKYRGGEEFRRLTEQNPVGSRYGGAEEPVEDGDPGTQTGTVVYMGARYFRVFFFFFITLKPRVDTKVYEP